MRVGACVRTLAPRCLALSVDSVDTEIQMQFSDNSGLLRPVSLSTVNIQVWTPAETAGKLRAVANAVAASGRLTDT